MNARAVTFVSAFVVAVAGVAWLMANNEQSNVASPDRHDAPVVAPAGGYVGSAGCRECHAAQFDAWQNSYHRTMTQVASPTAVQGNFNDVELVTQDYKCRLAREGEEFWVELPDEHAGGSATVRKQIVLCTGSHHMQVYWYPTGESRVLAQLPFVYLIEAQRWAPRNAAFLRPPERRPTTETGRWNQTCIKCHTTDGRPGIQDATHMDAHVSELGIACEACHGPGAEHVSDMASAMVNPAKLSHQRSAEVCGQCHSVSEFASTEDRDHWQTQGFGFRPGGELSAERTIIEGTPAAVRGRNVDYLHMVAGAFWSDGMVRVAGREFNGLRDSACFERGEMSCLSCHRMHQAADDPRPALEWANDQLDVGMDGNQACVQCHAQFAKEGAMVEHTHHAANSSGRVCYNCHMPHTSYGLMKATRSHQISSPSVAASVETGRPNACNQCHLDKTLEWTAGRLNDWYAIATPQLTSDQRTYAASVLWTLQGDAGQRALMAWSFGWAPAQQASGADWMIPLLAELLDDPYDAVRFMAYRSLSSIEGYEGFKFDFMASPGERAKQVVELLNRWRAESGGPSPRRIGKALLLDVNGDVRRDEIDRLLRERDNRPVTLVE